MTYNSSKINITFNQKNIYMTDKLNGNSKVNNIFGIININKEFELQKTIDLINKIIESNDALRISIIQENNEPYQIFNDFKYENIDNILIKQECDADKIIEEFSNDVIDINSNVLYKFKVININNEKGMILVKLHHIISDAWSFSKIAEQFINMYESNEINEENKMSFYDFALKEEEYLKSEKYLKDEEFFREYLSGINEKISFKEMENRTETYAADRYQIRLDEEINNKINEFCKENKISSYVLFLTILSVYMYRVLDKNDFIIGTPVLGRGNFAEKQIVGMFVSTIPLRVKINENMSVLELAKNISTDLMKIFRHQKYPYLKMLENVHKNTDIKNNLYDIVLSYQNARINNIYDEKYTTSWEFSNALYDELQIHIVDMDNTGTLAINYDYLKSHFKQVEIEYLHKRFVTMIEQFINFASISVEEIDILCDSDKKSINSINDTDVKIDYKQTPINMFKKQVVKNSNNIALVCNENKYTYKELDEITNRFANFLLSIGLKKSDVVGIMLQRSENIVISMLACSKIGVTYVPIDVRFPDERVNYILNNCKCKYVITTDDNKKIDAESIIIDEKVYQKYSNKDIKCVQDEKDICYLIYTSGSTGRPKGVMISNKNLSNFLLGINKELKLTSKDNLLSITTISFDIYELEMWLTLVNGATLCFANDNECINAKLLNEFCLKNNVNILQSTPTKIRLLLNQDSEKQYINNLEKILIGGECLDENLYNKIKENVNLKVFDVYGPTETTIWSTIKDITNSKISAGKPISNTKVFILDKKRRLLPIFTKGELAISGDSVSCGYFENEEKTKKSFVNVDFQKDIVYLTGDFSLINSDLDIEILNRIDNQIKINGQRIELEEIESLILDNDDISDAAISYRDKKYLVCFYSLKDKNKDIDLDSVKENLKNKLPIYMVPQIFIKLDKLPYTLNNKKDRKNINKIKITTEIDNKIEIIEPQTEIQKILLEEISKVTSLKQISVNTPISTMGIDSLDSIKMQMNLLKKGIKINYTDLLNNQDIMSLEKYILNNNLELDNKTYTLINEEYQSLLNSNSFDINKDNVKNIILTGATGFLGIHILDEILKQNKESIVYCIIRSKENKDSKQRLIENLEYYFDGRYINEIDKKIKVLDIDFNESDFDKKLNSNVKDVNFFIHAAACVKHYGDYEYFKTINVDATEKVAKYCLYNDINLIHTSTLSISGNGFDIGINNKKVKQKQFDETSLYIGQDLNNVYVKTKFEAECIVLKYIKLGLKANILRYGNLTNRMSDLKFQMNFNDNAFLDRISTLIKISALPENVKDIYLEFTPIDKAALATIKILDNFVSNKVYHIFNNNHIFIKDYINILNNKLGYKIDIVNNMEFSKIAKKMIDSSDDVISKTLVQDLDENYELNYNSNIKIMSERTNEFLKKCGFIWNIIDEKYVVDYIKYFKKLGYIK